MVGPKNCCEFSAHMYHSSTKYTPHSYLDLLDDCKHCLDPYFIPHKNANTLRRLLRFLNYEAFREIVKFPDGGETEISWSNVEGFTDATPIVVILPGMTGCGCSDYVTNVVKSVNSCKYR